MFLTLRLFSRSDSFAQAMCLGNFYWEHHRSLSRERSSSSTGPGHQVILKQLDSNSYSGEGNSEKFCQNYAKYCISLYEHIILNASQFRVSNDECTNRRSYGNVRSQFDTALMLLDSTRYFERAGEGIRRMWCRFWAGFRSSSGNPKFHIIACFIITHKIITRQWLYLMTHEREYV